MHPIVLSIRSLLDEHQVPYSFLEHEAGTTSEEMVEIRKDYSLSEGAKALILVTDIGFVQVVVPGDIRSLKTANCEKVSTRKIFALPRRKSWRPLSQMVSCPVLCHRSAPCSTSPSTPMKNSSLTNTSSSTAANAPPASPCTPRTIKPSSAPSLLTLLKIRVVCNVL